MFRCLKFIIIWPILYLGVWFLFICILQLNIDGNGLRGGANAPHNDSMYQVNHNYIRKGAPKGRDGRDSSLPVLKLVGIGRDDMVVIFKKHKVILVIFINPIQIFNNLIVIFVFLKNPIVICLKIDSDSLKNW